MDALIGNIKTLLENGFSSNSSVSFQSLSLWTTVGKEMHPSKRFYVHTVESRVGLAEGDDPTVFEQAYTVDGNYIGSIEDAEALCIKHKISPEKIQDNYSVCSIGKSDDGKWFGWSHRALSSFDTREEAAAFAESVSSSTIEEAKDHIENYITQEGVDAVTRKLFEDSLTSFSARAVNVVQCIWFRYNGARRVGLKTKEGDKFMVDKGDVFGVRYNQRQDQLEVYSDEALDLAFLADQKTIEKLVGNSKAYRGKVDGKVVPKQTDWLVPAQRKAYDRKHAVQAKPAKTPRAKTPKSNAPRMPKVDAIAAPKAVDVKVVPEQKLIAKAKRVKMDKYAWFKVTGKIPKLKCMDNGDEVEVNFEKNEVLGIRYAQDTNEIIVTLDEDNTLQFPITLNTLRKILKGVGAWSGTVNGLVGRAPRSVAMAQGKYWSSREFTKEYNSQARDQKAAVKVVAEQDFIESQDIDDDGLATGKKANKDLDKILNSGETVWFAAGVTNTARDKANVVFGESKKDVLGRLKPLMKGNAADSITTGIVSKAHGIYREYVEAGERKTGLTMHSGRIQPLVRDAIDDSVATTKSGNVVHQEVTVPDFNEKFEGMNVDKAPVFKGNDVEVLMQISNLITSRKAFTGAYQPLPKLKMIRAGECLLLKAKHNNERYRVEGTQVINRLRRFYGTKSISGAFKENDGNLFLVVYLANTRVKAHDGSMVEQNEDIRERALRIRRFMTNTTEEKQVSAQEEARLNQQRAKTIQSDRERLKAMDDNANTIETAIEKRTSKMESAKAQGSNVEQHEAKLAEYRAALKPLNSQRKALRNSIEKAVEEQERLLHATTDSRSVTDSVYMTKDGEQVVIVKANYPAGELIVSPIKGSKANYDRKIAVSELYDLGGKQVL